MATKPFDWPDCLSLAQELGARPEEVCLRTAIGRAYYYVYHLARQRVLDNGFPFTFGSDTHKQVWEKFSNSADLDCRKLAARASVLKEKRQRADYDRSYGRIQAEFPAILDSAKKFAEDLAKLKPDLPLNTGVKVAHRL
jgi:uncharacterized protein (UPF0332 family)